MGGKNRIKKKFNIGKLFILCSSILFLISVAASDTNIWAVSKEELQQEQQEAQQAIERLRRERQRLQEELKTMNSKLCDINMEIVQLQEQLSEVEQQIAESQQLLEQQEQLARQQYADMKLRIQYIYENGGTYTVNYLIGAQNITELLNRAQYMTDITNADRRLMEQYQQTIAALEEQKRTLYEQQEELTRLRGKLQGQQEQLISLIARAENDITSSEEQISNMQSGMEEILSRIEAMEAYEKQVEEQKAQEAKKAQEDAQQIAQIAQQEKELEEKRQQAQQKPVQVNPAVEGEETLLAALIYCESGGESYESQLAVGSVVLNRVSSSYFPDTITGVIYQEWQFSPAGSGKLAYVLEKNLTTDSCRRAAREVLDGNITGNWLYFCYNNGMVDGTVIGKQVFY